MPDGNDCPECGENVGVWAVLKAPRFGTINCPHCGRRLRYGNDWPIAAAARLSFAALLVTGLTVAVLIVTERAGFRPGIIESGLVYMAAGILLFLCWGAVEVVFVVILWYGGYRLETVNRPEDDWSDEAF